MARKRRSVPRSVSATAAAKTFGRLVDRVREERAEYLIERGGTPVARIVPLNAAACTLGELSDLLTRRVALDPAYLDEVEAGVKASNRPAVPGDPWTSS